jgi:hypothetical protein
MSRRIELVALEALPDPGLSAEQVGPLAQLEWYWIVRAASQILAAGAAPGPPGRGSQGQTWIIAEALLGPEEAPHAAALILEPISVIGEGNGGLYLDGRRRVAAMRAQGLEWCVASVDDWANR